MTIIKFKTCAFLHKSSNFRLILAFPSIVLTRDSGISFTALCVSQPMSTDVLGSAPPLTETLPVGLIFVDMPFLSENADTLASTSDVLKTERNIL